ncbi:MAG: hypothetical protein OEV40_29700 [Acidimicrobiia bacterium]|nr:hypothetical protein [Acidimicrobiia bacterium]
MAGHRGRGQVATTALRAEDPDLRALALGAALRQKNLTVVALESCLADPSPTVRRRAAELAPRLATLLRAEDPACGGRLTAAVVDLLDDAECAEVAAFALGELGHADAKVVAALERQGGAHDDPLCRESAVAALGALGAGRATVLAALGDVATVRRRAVIALANLDGDDIVEALRAALDDRDWQVRQAAEDLLDDGGD